MRKWSRRTRTNLEELSFVPSAVSEPLWALLVCDNKCRAKGFKFFEVAAVVSQRTRSTFAGVVTM